MLGLLLLAYAFNAFNVSIAALLPSCFCAPSCAPSFGKEASNAERYLLR